MVWAPRGLVGPDFRLFWAAGGQVGWPSRWGHLGWPGGRSAAADPRSRVRFLPLGAWGAKFSRSVASEFRTPTCGAAVAPPHGRKNKKGTELVLDLRGGLDHEIGDWKLVGICFWRLRRWLLRAAAAWATSRASLGLPRCTWTTSMTLSRDGAVVQLPAEVLRGLSRPQRRDATGADWRE